MRVGSLFSGIGGLDLGLARAGHDHAWFCEIDPYRRAVLAKHWPGVPIYQDVHEIAQGNGRGGQRELGGNGHGADSGRQWSWATDGDVDLVCGGFPCQDLSRGGAKRGLAGKRSGLFFEFARVADAVLADGDWLLLENVPGLLSTNNGRDFAVLLATLAELRFYDLAWRVLDSRYFGVPQRRQRVFILARRARGRRACEVLLDPESGGGDFEASRETRQGSAASFAQGLAGPLGNRQSGGFRTTDLDNQGAYVAGDGPAADPYDSAVSHPVTASQQRLDGTVETYVVGGEAADADRMREAAGPAGRVDGDPMTFSLQPSDKRDGKGALTLRPADVAPPVVAKDGESKTDRGLRVLGRGRAGGDRCAIDPLPDGRRYAGCGDAVTVNVAYWIGCRLAKVLEANQQSLAGQGVGPGQ